MKRVCALDTSSRTGLHTYFSRALRSSAPGSSPASHRIWKPLHTPTTAAPRPAAFTTSRMTGDCAAIAPARR